MSLHGSSSSEGDYADIDINEPLNFLRPRALAVSAEADAPSAEFIAPKIDKTAEQAARIRDMMSKHFLFGALELEAADEVIAAFSEYHVKKGEVLMRQGEEGNCLYMVDTGTFAVYKSGSGGEERVNTMTSGSTIGELALLYLTPRAATVVAESDGIIWKLDRKPFTYIVRGAAIQKRQQLLNALTKITLLQEYDQQQLTQLADAAVTLDAAADEVIIREGEAGDAFYIILKGVVSITRSGEYLMTRHDGDYFGELALLTGAPRAATVIANTLCKLIRFDVASFNRVLAPLRKTLEELAKEYGHVHLV